MAKLPVAQQAITSKKMSSSIQHQFRHFSTDIREVLPDAIAVYCSDRLHVSHELDGSYMDRIPVQVRQLSSLTLE
uniref:Transposase n=1 Tax=Heterorhabditis bacteriophora TaxID=37862 RepID=A0A1I7XD49_HETBA